MTGFANQQCKYNAFLQNMKKYRDFFVCFLSRTRFRIPFSSRDGTAAGAARNLRPYGLAGGDRPETKSRRQYRRLSAYSEPGSNRHGHYWPQDFKSGVSTDSTIRAAAFRSKGRAKVRINILFCKKTLRLFGLKRRNAECTRESVSLCSPAIAAACRNILTNQNYKPSKSPIKFDKTSIYLPNTRL